MNAPEFKLFLFRHPGGAPIVKAAHDNVEAVMNMLEELDANAEQTLDDFGWEFVGEYLP